VIITKGKKNNFNQHKTSKQTTERKNKTTVSLKKSNAIIDA